MRCKKIISAALAATLVLGTLAAPSGVKPIPGVLTADAEEYVFFIDNITNLTAVPGNNNVLLKWDPYEGASKYSVNYGLAGQDTALFQSVTETSCNVTGLESGTAYDFTIIAYNSNNSWIAWASKEKVFTKGAKTTKNEDSKDTKSNDTKTSKNASSKDFVIKTDKEGKKYVASYKGKGGKVTIPSTVDYIGEKAFAQNQKITEVVFPSNCSFVDNFAFQDCFKLEKVVFEGDASFNAQAFDYCISLKSVEVGGSVYDAINTGAFAHCQSLETFSVKKNEKEFWIGPNAFYDCYSLKSVDIPDKCAGIYGKAFLNCTSLEKITIPAKAEIIFNDSFGSDHFGFFNGAKTEDDYLSNKFYTAKADGKTSVYLDFYSTSGGYDSDIDGLYYNCKKFTPKKLTMTVTKGSDAEKYAKKYGIDYKYDSSASSSSAKLAAPTNFKVKKKSASSITLSWDAVEGADGYTVYLYNSETGKYEKYKTVKSAQCTVSGLKKGTTYKLKVVALDKVNGKYQKGTISKPVSVKTKNK